MKVHLLSDLHFEFRPNYLDLLHTFPKTPDLVLLGGDTCSSSGLLKAWADIAEHYFPTPVVAVLGNHEFYGSGTVKILRKARDFTKPNFTLLENSSVFIQGKKIIGGTMWFPQDPDWIRWKDGLNDFSQIKGLVPWVFEENDRAIKHLDNHILDADIVLTHHIPCQQLVNPKFKTEKLNMFYVGKADKVIYKHIDHASPDKKLVWCFGHSHDPTDEVIQNIRFLCNPLGYPAYCFEDGGSGTRTDRPYKPLEFEI